jgi:hypothetical protein
MRHTLIIELQPRHPVWQIERGSFSIIAATAANRLVAS